MLLFKACMAGMAEAEAVAVAEAVAEAVAVKRTGDRTREVRVEDCGSFSLKLLLLLL